MVAECELPMIRGKLKKEMLPMYEALVREGYTPTDMAREGVRSLYRRLKNETQQEAIA